MNQVIIFVQDNGIPAVIYPTLECLSNHSIYEIALKDVPSGKKFKIVNLSQLPLNIPQEAWEINESELTDGIGNDATSF